MDQLSALANNLKEISIIENGKEHVFIAPRLAPSQQLKLMKKIINVVASGSLHNKLEVAQILHNALSTGAKIDGATEIENSFKLIADAILGALSVLTDDLLDEILNMLYQNVTIKESGGGIQQVDKSLLDNVLTNWQSLLKLAKELVSYNLGFL